MTAVEIPLPYESPPLSLNHRRNRWRHASKVKQVRKDTFVLSRLYLRGTWPQVRVTLHYRPPDRRRRDVDNLVATQKVCCDALVDAGVVVDDDPAHMIKQMPVIHEMCGPPAMWLVVELPDATSGVVAS